MAPHRARSTCLKGIALVVAAAALAWTFREVRVDRVLSLLGGFGAVGVLMALTPQVLGLALETLGWRAAFTLMGERVGFRALLWVRVATEALVLVVPGGAVVTEPVKVPLLQRHANLDASSAVAGILARKYLLLGAQALWLGLAAAMGALALMKAPIGGPVKGLVVAVVVASLGLGCAALFLRLLLSRGGVATRVRCWLTRLPNEALRRTLARSQATFERTDGRLAALFAVGGWREVAVGLAFVAAWAAETLETFVLLRLLGVELDFGVVALLEVAMTLLRNIVFVVPAGIGVQDLGYALLLRLLGVVEATELAAAFTLLKRGKELLLVTLGLGLLGVDQGRARGAAEAEKTAAALQPLG